MQRLRPGSMRRDRRRGAGLESAYVTTRRHRAGQIRPRGERAIHDAESPSPRAHPRRCLPGGRYSAARQNPVVRRALHAAAHGQRRVAAVPPRGQLGAAVGGPAPVSCPSFPGVSAAHRGASGKAQDRTRGGDSPAHPDTRYIGRPGKFGKSGNLGKSGRIGRQDLRVSARIRAPGARAASPR